MNEQDKQEVLLKCCNNTLYTSKIFFPNRFRLPFSTGHRKIFEALDDPTKQRVLIMAPRGFGKTSIGALAYPARNIMFNHKKFVVYIEHSADNAQLQTESLKKHFERNRLIKGLFPDFKSNNWSKEQWIAEAKIEVDPDDPMQNFQAYDTMMLPRGAGQQVRGLLYGDYRPDLVVVNDVEDRDSIHSEDARNKVKHWFYEDVYNCIDESNPTWKIVVIGTLLHEDSLLAELEENDEWHTIKLEICDDNFKSNWPEFMSDERVKQKANEFRNRGKIDSFFREYRNLVISGEDSGFKSEYFKYYDEGTGLDLNQTVENIVLVDPAKTNNARSAESAVVCVGLDLINAKYYIRDIIRGHFFPDELYDEIFRCASFHNCKVIGVETTGLADYFMHPFKSFMLRNGYSFQIEELKPGRGSKRGENKIERIKGLVPFYRKGMIYHNKACCNVLEQQLLSFPRSKKLDVMDCTAYLVQMLEKGERYLATEETILRKMEKEKKTEELFHDDYADEDWEFVGAV